MQRLAGVQARFIRHLFVLDLADPRSETFRDSCVCGIWGLLSVWWIPRLGTWSRVRSLNRLPQGNLLVQWRFERLSSDSGSKPSGLPVLHQYQSLLQRGEPLETVLSALPDWQESSFHFILRLAIRWRPLA